MVKSAFAAGSTKRFWSASWMHGDLVARPGRFLEGLALPLHAGEGAVGDQRFAAFLGALFFVQLVEDLEKIVKRLGVLGLVLIVDDVDPEELPARFLELFGIVIGQAQRVVGARFEALVAGLLGQRAQ